MVSAATASTAPASRSRETRACSVGMAASELGSTRSSSDPEPSPPAATAASQRASSSSAVRLVDPGDRGEGGRIGHAGARRAQHHGLVGDDRVGGQVHDGPEAGTQRAGTEQLLELAPTASHQVGHGAIIPSSPNDR